MRLMRINNKMANDCLQICTWIAMRRKVCMCAYILTTYTYVHVYVRICIYVFQHTVAVHILGSRIIKLRN